MRALPGLLVAASVAAGPDARAEAPKPPESGALRTLEALQGAHADRMERLRLQSEGRAESGRIAAQIAEAEAQAELARVRARRSREALAELRAESGPLDAREAELVALMDAVAARVDDALDALAARSLPDLVPPRAAPTPVRSEDRFEAALDRLEKTERRLAQIEVTIVQTQLDGQDVAVEVLRFGGAAAWWRALDGDRFGVVRILDGAVELQARTGAGLDERVEAAFAIAKGRAAPELLLLPLVPLADPEARG